MTEQDYFVAHRIHFMNTQTMSEIDYYPQMHRFGKSVEWCAKGLAGRSLRMNGRSLQRR